VGARVSASFPRPKTEDVAWCQPLHLKTGATSSRRTGMSALEQIGARPYARLDPERAHSLACKVLRLGLTAKPGPGDERSIADETVAGLSMANPHRYRRRLPTDAEAITP